MNTVKAVVGAIYNNQSQLLISKRQAHQFMPGFWELPGGKINEHESKKAAIARELKEELGIVVKKASLYKQMSHVYADRVVQLWIYNIDEYLNEANGLEGQQINWVDISDLYNHELLPTMKAFIDSITLPKKYWITPSSNHTSTAWIEKFEQKLNTDISLIQLRSKNVLDELFVTELHNKCRQNGIKLMLNTPHKSFNEAHCDGWHITTQEMMGLSTRPCADDKLLGASTHNLDEALKAQELGADFVVISPVQATQTHPDSQPIGWERATEVVEKLNIPVYLLGGMGLKDLDKAIKLGAQGIAGVSAL